MATDFFSLPINQQVKLSTDVALKKAGITVPITTGESTTKLNVLVQQEKTQIRQATSAINSLIDNLAQQVSSTLGVSITSQEARQAVLNQSTTLAELGIPTSEVTALLPPGYTVGTLTLQQLLNVSNALVVNLENIQKNPSQLPPTGATVTYNPNNTTPPIGTNITATVVSIPTNTTPKSTEVVTTQPVFTPTVSTPKTTTNPSNSGITTSDIIKAAVLVEGSVALYNALNTPTVTRIESPAPTPIPVTVQADIEIPVDKVDIATDPNTNIGNENIENSTPATIDVEDAIEKARLESQAQYENTPPVTEQDIFAAEGVTNAKGLQGKLDTTRARQITQDAENAKTQGDWRVRLSLAPSADYLYKADNPGILKYLQDTDGIVFPYTPQISVNYAAHYDTSDLIHSNYKIYQYKSSSVDQLTINCDFTAQDTFESNYLLAVIHFFRSVTKMFYGQDQLPKPGTPPPLCYLSGLGGFQFDRHPLVITSFNYSLPNDVDYIRAGSPTLQPGVDSTGYNSKGIGTNIIQTRLKKLLPGAQVAAPQFTKATNTQPTYVPTKIQISLTAYPIVTRNDISNKFSLKDYATGSLLQGSRRNGGGIW